jgi:hypothetical protein
LHYIAADGVVEFEGFNWEDIHRQHNLYTPIASWSADQQQALVDQYRADLEAVGFNIPPRML